MNKTSSKYPSVKHLYQGYSRSSLSNEKKRQNSKNQSNNSFTKGYSTKLSLHNESTNESRLKVSSKKIHLNRTRSASGKRNPLIRTPSHTDTSSKRLSSAKKQTDTIKSNISQHTLPGLRKKKEAKAQKSASDVYHVLFKNLMDSQSKIGVCDYKGLFNCLIGSFDSLTKVDDKFKNISQILRIYLDTEYENQELKRVSDQKKQLEEKVAKLQVAITELKRDNSAKAKNLRSLKNQTKEDVIDKRIVRKMKEKLENKAREFENENMYLRQMLNDKAKELNLSLKKEKKLVKIIYNLHKKGYPVEELLEEESSESDLTQSTIYFPDKVEMRPAEKKVPGLNFENLEEYVSSDEEESQPQKPIKGFNEEFMDHVEDFSKSWREQVEAVKKRIN